MNTLFLFELNDEWIENQCQTVLSLRNFSMSAAE